jgi:hypothetical protein
MSRVSGTAADETITAEQAAAPLTRWCCPRGPGNISRDCIRGHLRASPPRLFRHHKRPNGNEGLVHRMRQSLYIRGRGFGRRRSQGAPNFLDARQCRRGRSTHFRRAIAPSRIRGVRSRHGIREHRGKSPMPGAFRGPGARHGRCLPVQMVEVVIASWRHYLPPFRGAVKPFFGKAAHFKGHRMRFPMRFQRGALGKSQFIQIRDARPTRFPSGTKPTCGNRLSWLSLRLSPMKK